MKDYPYLERLAAAIIDSFFVSILSSIILIPAFLTTFFVIVPFMVGTTSEVVNGVSNYNPNNTIMMLLIVSAIVLFALLLVFIGHYYYYVLRPAKNDGQTFGKGLMKIKITRSDGQKLTKSTLFWRYVVMTLIIQLVGPLVFITIFFDDENRSIYDILVGTKVVRVSD